MPSSSLFSILSCPPFQPSSIRQQRAPQHWTRRMEAQPGRVTAGIFKLFKTCQANGRNLTSSETYNIISCAHLTEQTLYLLKKKEQTRQDKHKYIKVTLYKRKHGNWKQLKRQQLSTVRHKTNVNKKKNLNKFLFSHTRQNRFQMCFSYHVMFILFHKIFIDLRLN